MEATVFRAARIPIRSTVTPSGLLRWTYWKEYTASEPAYRQFVDGSDVDRLKVQLVYKSKTQAGLWWWANCAASINPKASIRSTRTRDLRRAFADALRDRGFDGQGNREDGQLGLSGSLQMLGLAKVADPRWETTLRQDCEAVLRQVMYWQRDTDQSMSGHRNTANKSSLQSSRLHASQAERGHPGKGSRSIKLR